MIIVERRPHHRRKTACVERRNILVKKNAVERKKIFLPANCSSEHIKPGLKIPRRKRN